MKILIAPLNWGLGHATRCIPLIRKYIAEKNEVVLAGDGDSLLLLKRTFPTLRIVSLAPLRLTYSRSASQTWAVLRSLPALIRFSVRDHKILCRLLHNEHFDLVISDNRFGLFPPEHRPADTSFVYITHQLHIRLPRFWRWLEPLAYRLHRSVYRRFDQLWVPDFADRNMRLAGFLSSGGEKENARYIGPLSRMEPSQQFCRDYHTVAVLSGLEPQRTLFEQQLVKRFENTDKSLLIVRGKVGMPFVRTRHRNITLVPSLPDELLVPLLQGAEHIICRSGYSSVMDLAALNLLDKAELVSTPGQPEQEYIASYISRRAPSPGSAT